VAKLQYPYKGKGIRYDGEHVKIKPGKAATLTIDKGSPAGDMSVAGLTWRQPGRANLVANILIQSEYREQAKRNCQAEAAA
jgi:hypothetical protein